MLFPQNMADGKVGKRFVQLENETNKDTPFPGLAFVWVRPDPVVTDPHGSHRCGNRTLRHEAIYRFQIGKLTAPQCTVSFCSENDYT